MLKVRQERQRRGISQAKLACLTGIGAPDLSSMELGIRKPFPGWKKRIARALGVTGAEADRLFEEVDATDEAR
ncbi:MAG: helix-turn-helix transcriptional regulator [Firmicutes bacterium]|nr:helix-turn-helix transcriptional regulator [Bacillota bacterium]MBV1727307.1 helix-turn-helix transcriptional regulator [Desulforudis sp.]MBV1736420.1 helix-turn-helix transcriptional regulator [Desulforudis sp.]MBV1770607.1 helix-turn-helix transcriptional regulator [Desulforudis sp.]